MVTAPILARPTTPAATLRRYMIMIAGHLMIARHMINES